MISNYQGMLVGQEDEALAHCVRECALHGTSWSVLTPRDVVWDIEPDTKVDPDDLAFPVIVHMRGGTVASDGIVVVAEKTEAE